MNKCTSCGSEDYTFKFGKLYQCNFCKSHFYGNAPTKEEKERTVEEIVFEERIQERKKRNELSAIEAEILKLAAEARAESEKYPEEASHGMLEVDREDSEPVFIPPKSPGRPRKVQ